MWKGKVRLARFLVRLMEFAHLSHTIGTALDFPVNVCQYTLGQANPFNCSLTYRIRTSEQSQNQVSEDNARYPVLYPHRRDWSSLLPRPNIVGPRYLQQTRESSSWPRPYVMCHGIPSQNTAVCG